MQDDRAQQTEAGAPSGAPEARRRSECLPHPSSADIDALQARTGLSDDDLAKAIGYSDGQMIRKVRQASGKGARSMSRSATLLFWLVAGEITVDDLIGEGTRSSKKSESGTGLCGVG